MMDSSFSELKYIFKHIQILQTPSSTRFNNHSWTTDWVIIELNGLRNNRLLLLSTIMVDSLRDDNAAPCNKRAARSEKTVIVGEHWEEKDTRKRGRDEARRRKVGREEDPCHTRTTDSSIVLHALIPAIRARARKSTNEHYSHKSWRYQHHSR